MIDQEGEKCEKLSRKTFEIHVKINARIVAFLSSVVYYFEDLLKSVDMAFVRHKTFISL